MKENSVKRESIGGSASGSSSQESLVKTNELSLQFSLSCSLIPLTFPCTDDMTKVAIYQYACDRK